MAIALPSLGAHRVITGLPEFSEPDEMLLTCELLCQEGFSTWSLPLERLAEVAGLLAAFGRRARIGIHGVTSAAQVRRVADSGAVFAASLFGLAKLVKAVPDFPVILGGLTPTELRSSLDAGAAAAQVIPAQAYSTAYARALPRLLGYPQLLASGRLEARTAALWLRAGAIGVWPSGMVGDDLLGESGLEALREHLQQWRLGD